MLQIDLEYNIDFEMECPQLDERLQSLTVVACSHGPLCINCVQLSCIILRGVVPLCIVAVSFIPHAPFVHALCTFHGLSTLDFHVPCPLLCMFLCASLV